MKEKLKKSEQEVTSLKQQLAEKNETIHTMQDEIRESKANMQEKIKKAVEKEVYWAGEGVRVISKEFSEQYRRACKLEEELKSERRRKVNIRQSEIKTRQFFTMWTYILATIIMLKNKVIMFDLISVIKCIFRFWANVGKVQFELIRIIASVTYHIPNYTVNLILHWFIITFLMLILNGAVGCFLHKGFYLIGSIVKKYWDKKQTAISAIIVIIFTVLGDVLPFKTILHINLVALAILIFILTIIIRIIKFYKKK